ncbi:MAG: 4Fe-4S binding protein, partial [Dehalococcoidia bacterium]|nr:4Fe-4S binding protein [Dehalococcoidia bacterium]
PSGAIGKRGKDGIVVVDRDKCNGCRDCLPACPYGVPQFDEDGIMQMCDFCTGVNMEPACAVSCPAGALNFGTLDELLKMARRKAATRMGGRTEPSVIIVGELQLPSLAT